MVALVRCAHRQHANERHVATMPPGARGQGLFFGRLRQRTPPGGQVGRRQSGAPAHAQIWAPNLTLPVDLPVCAVPISNAEAAQGFGRPTSISKNSAGTMQRYLCRARCPRWLEKLISRSLPIGNAQRFSPTSVTPQKRLETRPPLRVITKGTRRLALTTDVVPPPQGCLLDACLCYQLR